MNQLTPYTAQAPFYGACAVSNSVRQSIEQKKRSRLFHQNVASEEQSAAVIATAVALNSAHHLGNLPALG